MSKKADIKKITITIENCKKCDLYKTRINPVVGYGSIDANILFIGEAPGRNEDLQGKPFVGKAGAILDEMIQSIGLNRDEVFIANIIKCRPPKNRNPLNNEIKACTEYLDKQIKIIKPKIIVPLGNFASKYIFKKFNLKYDKISKIHGNIFQPNTIFGVIKIIPSYHPAAATYNPNIKDILIKDFELIKNSFKYF